MRVVGLGLSVIDHLYVVDDPDLTGVRTRFSDRRVCAGGMIGTATAQAAQLGADAHILSVLGDDADGRFVRSALKAHGVETKRLLLSSAS
jgi:sugar/nucleoside kinase (ribokinase family)